MQCPNCSNPVPVEAIDALRRYSEAYLDLIDVIFHENTQDNAWGINIVGSEKVIPEKPDYYFYKKAALERSFWEHRNKPFEPAKTEFIDDEDLPY